MLEDIRYLSIEIGPDCTQDHEWCPIKKVPRLVPPARLSSWLTPEEIADIIRRAHTHGFDGKVAFHYYNEPLLHAARINAVMDRVPQARYLLWTNGDLLEEEAQTVARFDEVIVTDYAGRGRELMALHPNLSIYPAVPDNRLLNYRTQRHPPMPCVRPKVEIPVTYQGEMRLCCQDWAGRCHIADVREHDSFAKWNHLARGVIKGEVPDVCLRCTNPLSR